MEDAPCFIEELTAEPSWIEKFLIVDIFMYTLVHIKVILLIYVRSSRKSKIITHHERSEEVSLHVTLTLLSHERRPSSPAATSVVL